ncbi:unnamed protein product [Strongylus vulgaris]|uniref:Reverse transcriptase domain-containing protein n=1 Tax=Strongylus vulgaris TaxID=40348 RepID=A0A3P7JFM5_STRVU|nr:unnamed protein product [Strongylus vulgaris]
MVGTAKAHGFKSIHPMDQNDLWSHEPCANCGRAVKTILHKERRTSGIDAPLIFIAVADAVTKGLKRQPPRALLYADDVVYGRKQKNLEEREGGQTSETLIIDEKPIKKTSTFTYPGSRISGDEGFQSEISAGTNAHPG